MFRRYECLQITVDVRYFSSAFFLQIDRNVDEKELAALYSESCLYSSYLAPV